ncbi:MAG TPA: hypothetical protein VJA82_02150 [Sediminibacterium sp.]|uniref:hypothetical protein n=1 Tax=Sediminibacterium sp. TaxID=1917865 RepID=UPI0008D5BBD2|nr:hypothetical protein [Sediminibacterium sp.]OHC84126.1 MAG: hypothetical protein A2472_13620 [Sphingobacteriia bacterium RIFOXYC2_FULL_35_18]OHC87827.1 MAG: hypothetical protein A2546_05550 [Sphingobacteriia bacterium RIFOXYD2_FULL_35_12]HLD52082.1 hypothetical protein [Sediminibacterium sp.]
MKTIFFLLLLIAQAFIVILPYQGKLTDNRKKFPKNFTRYGWVLISLSAFNILLTIWIFTISERENTQNALDLKKAVLETTNLASSNYEKKLDSNNLKTIELLAKYGLKYDSAQKIISKLIIDSSRKTIIQNDVNPTLDFANDVGIQFVSRSKDSYDFNIVTYSFESSTKNLDAKLLAVIKLKNGNLSLISRGIIYGHKNIDVPFNTFFEYGCKFQSKLDFDVVYFILIGTYFNTSGNKKFELNSIRGFDMNRNKLIAPLSDDEEEIRKIIKM